MSHNAKYYFKRLTKKDAKGMAKIGDVFKKLSNVGTLQEPPGNSPRNSTTASGDTIRKDVKFTMDQLLDSIVVRVDECSQIINENQVPESVPVEVVSSAAIEPRTATDQRKFTAFKYELQYKWLYFSYSKEGFMCKYCEMFTIPSSSVKPFVSHGVQIGTHPTRQLSSHQESNSHTTAMERFNLSQSNVNVLRQMQISQEKGKQLNREVVKKIFLCVDFLIKQKWAATKNTEKLVKFVASMGVKDLQQHINTSEVKYLSSGSISDMILCLSELLEQELLQDLRIKEFALLADESSDIAHRSQLSIMARFSKENETVNTHFLGFAQLSRMTAEAIFTVIETFLRGKGVSMSNIRFMGFDGCNTMSGERTGLQRRIRHVSPFAVYINCRNHRLALCLAHLIKRFPLLQDVDSALLALWKMFEFSPQKMAVFKKIQDCYGNHPLVITRAATTRWLSHLHASSKFISRYVCILDTLDAIYNAKKEPEVYGVRHAVTNKKTVATILLLCDVLKPVNMLSLYLQEEQVNFTTLPEHVKATTDSLTGLVEIYRTYMDSHTLQESGTEFAKCHQLFSEIDDRTDLARRVRGDRHTEITPEHFLEEIGIPLVYSLIQEVEDAFTIGVPVLTGFGYLNPLNLPDTVTELNDYGETSIQRMVNFYTTAKEDTFKGHTLNVPRLMDPLQLESQLRSFRIQLFMLRARGLTTVSSVYQEFVKDKVLRECFPLVYQLYYYSLLIPSSTAVVERSFSLMSNILTKKRNKLTEKNLDATMRICHFNRTLTNQDLESLVDIFKGQKGRKMDL